MFTRIKGYLFAAVAAGVVYFFASQHVIILDKTEFELLEKPYLTFEYTFFILKDKRPEKVMRIDILRDAGIGELMVDLGMLSEDNMLQIQSRYYYDEDYEEEDFN